MVAGTLLPGAGGTSVSYTHLDVYKRQRIPIGIAPAYSIQTHPDFLFCGGRVQAFVGFILGMYPHEGTRVDAHFLQLFYFFESG